MTNDGGNNGSVTNPLNASTNTSANTVNPSIPTSIPSGLLQYKKCISLAASLNTPPTLLSLLLNSTKLLIHLSKLKAALAELNNCKELIDAVGGSAKLFTPFVDVLYDHLAEVVNRRLEDNRRDADNKEGIARRISYLNKRVMAVDARKVASERMERDRKRVVERMKDAVGRVQEKGGNVKRVREDYKDFVKNFKEFDVMEYEELRKHFRAYSNDMSYKEMSDVICCNVAPVIVNNIINNSVNKVLANYATKVAETRSLNKQKQMYLNLKHKQDAKIKRITLYQQERSIAINHLLINSKTVDEACRNGVPVDMLKHIVERDCNQAVHDYYDKSNSSSNSNSNSSSNNNNSSNSGRKIHSKHCETTTIFEQLVREGNAMNVESAHPYTKNAYHVVQLIPNVSNYSLGDTNDGLVVAFHDFCDMKAGAAEIRLFRDDSCLWPIITNSNSSSNNNNNEPLRQGNLPTIDKPLFVENADSITLQFKCDSWDGNLPINESWGWKMLVCKCRTKEQFLTQIVPKAVSAAAVKSVIGSQALSIACYTGNVAGVKYLIEKGEEHGYDINKKNPVTGSTLVHDAVRGDSVGVLELLLDKGAKRNIANSQNETPLHFATRLNRLGCVRVLMYEGRNGGNGKDSGKNNTNSNKAAGAAAAAAATAAAAAPDPKMSNIALFRQQEKKERFVLNMRKKMLSAKNHRGRTPKEIAGMKGVREPLGGGSRGGGGGGGGGTLLQTPLPGLSSKRPTSAVVRSQNSGLVDILNPVARKVPARKSRPETAPAARRQHLPSATTTTTTTSAMMTPIKKKTRPQTATARGSTKPPSLMTTAAATTTMPRGGLLPAGARKLERPKTAGGKM
jgi:hypothetical protein